jgi:2-keto-3-deoxy-L-rhamnonate aldolase RhmA
MLANQLKKKLRHGEQAIGTWMTFDFWPGYLEIYKRAGLDCVIVDLEHGSAGYEAVDRAYVGVARVKAQQKPNWRQLIQNRK